MAIPVSADGSRKARVWRQAVILCLGGSLAVGCAKNHASSPSEEAFLRGRGMVTQGKYADAIPVLERYLQDFPQGKYASRAGLFLGKAHLGLGRFDEARSAFERTAQEFPETLEGHKCRYKLAFVAAMTGDLDEARRGFEALAARPDGPLAPEAKAFAEFLKDGAARPEEPSAKAN